MLLPNFRLSLISPFLIFIRFISTIVFLLFCEDSLIWDWAGAVFKLRLMSSLYESFFSFAGIWTLQRILFVNQLIYVSFDTLMSGHDGVFARSQIRYSRHICRTVTLRWTCLSNWRRFLTKNDLWKNWGYLGRLHTFTSITVIKFLHHSDALIQRWTDRGMLCKLKWLGSIIYSFLLLTISEGCNWIEIFIILLFSVHLSNVRLDLTCSHCLVSIFSTVDRLGFTTLNRIFGLLWGLIYELRLVMIARLLLLFRYNRLLAVL